MAHKGRQESWETSIVACHLQYLKEKVNTSHGFRMGRKVFLTTAYDRDR